jgi:hypothetical protein
MASPASTTGRGRRSTRSTPDSCPAVRRAALPWPSPPARPTSPTARTRGARSGSRPPVAASRGSRPHGAASPSPGSGPSPRASTRSVRWRSMSPAWRRAWPCSSRGSYRPRTRRSGSAGSCSTPTRRSTGPWTPPSPPRSSRSGRPASTDSTRRRRRGWWGSRAASAGRGRQTPRTTVPAGCASAPPRAGRRPPGPSPMAA